MAHLTFGTTCHRGFGFDHQFFRLVESTAESRLENHVTNVLPENVRIIDRVVLLSGSTVNVSKLSSLLDPTLRKHLDHEIILDDVECFGFVMTMCFKRNTCDSCSPYPDFTDHFVNAVEYGVYLDVVLPKTNFPVDADGFWQLLNQKLAGQVELTEVQLDTKCSVRISSNDAKEMTLREVLNFKDEECKYRDSQIPVKFDIKFTKEVPYVYFHNQEGFEQFLFHLYTCFRKIEMKLEKAGYPNLVAAPEPETSVVKVVANLMRAKEDYKTMNTNDFYKMYPAMKTLFHRYIDYLKLVIDSRLSIDEGADLPGNFEDIKPWLKSLNYWMPVCVANKWYGTEGRIFVTPGGFPHVEDKICEIAAYKEIIFRVDTCLTEPHIFLFPHVDSFFGFVDMSGAQKEEDAGNATVLQAKCPENCTDDMRKWICNKCGDVVRTCHAQLVCTCGSKWFDKRLITCNNPKHEIQPNLFRSHVSLESLHTTSSDFEKVEEAQFQD